MNSTSIFQFLVFTRVTFVLTTAAIRTVGAQTISYKCNRSKVCEKVGMVLCVVFGCGSRSDRDKGIGFYRIPSVIKNKSSFEEELTTRRRRK